MVKDLEKRAEELDRRMYGENLPFVRRHNEEAEEFNRTEGVKAFLSGNSLMITGTYFSFKDLCRSDPKSAKLLMDFYEGKVDLMTIAKKVYGYGRSLSMVPSEDELRVATQTPF